MKKPKLHPNTYNPPPKPEYAYETAYDLSDEDRAKWAKHVFDIKDSGAHPFYETDPRN